MLTIIKGVYHNGQVILDEKPDVQNDVEVLVTFTEVLKKTASKPLKAGYAKGTVTYISPGFDEPLDEMKDYM